MSSGKGPSDRRQHRNTGPHDNCDCKWCTRYRYIAETVASIDDYLKKNKNRPPKEPVLVIHPNGDIQVNGRWLNIDSEVSIEGARGRFRYTGHSRNSDGKIVLYFIGGRPGHEMMRAFYPERVKRVHNTKKRAV